MLFICLHFQSTSNRSGFRITREFESFGGFLHASANRESVVITSEALRSNIPAVIDTFADILSSPVFFPGKSPLRYVFGNLSELLKMLFFVNVCCFCFVLLTYRK